MNDEQTGTYALLGVTLVILILLGIAGTLDFEEEEKSLNEYCEMVKRGDWPDYEGTYHDFCERSDDEP
jgi:hypothetical protein